MAWFLVPPGSLFYTYSKRNGTNILYTITWLQLDTRPLYLPLHAHPPTLNRPLPDAEPPPLVLPAPVQNPDTGIKFLCFPSHLTVYIQPLNMELTQGSETSANYNLTPGKYPKEHIQYSNHGKSLKSSSQHMFQILLSVHLVLIFKWKKMNCYGKQAYYRYGIWYIQIASKASKVPEQMDLKLVPNNCNSSSLFTRHSCNIHPQMWNTSWVTFIYFYLFFVVVVNFQSVFCRL